jgi:ABC-type phosphate transport system permease subunit
MTAVNFTELIDLMNALPDVIYPVLAIMVIVIVIKAYGAVGAMISGILEAVVDMIRGGMGKK